MKYSHGLVFISFVLVLLILVFSGLMWWIYLYSPGFIYYLWLIHATASERRRSLIGWDLAQTQGSFCECTQPMRDEVTMSQCLSLAGCIHKMIPAALDRKRALVFFTGTGGQLYDCVKVFRNHVFISWCIRSFSSGRLSKFGCMILIEYEWGKTSDSHCWNYCPGIIPFAWLLTWTCWRWVIWMSCSDLNIWWGTSFIVLGMATRGALPFQLTIFHSIEDTLIDVVLEMINPIFLEFSLKVKGYSSVCHTGSLFWNYCQPSNICRTLVGNKIVDHSDVVGASPAGAAPTTSSF